MDVSVNDYLPELSHTATVQGLASRLGMALGDVLQMLRACRREVNPMMGARRGCRLSMLLPILLQMETAALIGTEH